MGVVADCQLVMQGHTQQNKKETELEDGGLYLRKVSDDASYFLQIALYKFD